MRNILSRKFIMNNPIRKLFAEKISNKIIGIDLGTTNSCVAVSEGNSTKVIENNEGMRTMPSFIAFGEDGSQLVGLPAKRQSVTNPNNTFYATKRLMGRRFDDKETQHHIKSLSYKVVKAENGDAWVQTTDNKKYSPSQAAAFILRNLKEVAEGYLEEGIDKAVITVPAYFNDSQRQATKDAGRIAGLEVKRIINEPTAAAIAYGLDKNTNKKIAVYDLGGGTFDVSILELSDGVFEVKATNGDTSLGGEDFDTYIQNHILDKFKEQFKIDLRNNSISMQRIKEASEKAKIELSSVTSTDIDLPFLFVDKTGPKNFKMKLTREKLEILVKDLLERTIKPCEICLKDSGLSKDQIQEIILVGGMTRMPKVVEFVKNFFGRESNKTINPDEAVAIGAAIQGGVLVGEFKDIVLIDVTPLSLGTDSHGDVFVRIINKNSAVPCKKTSSFTTVSDGQTSVRFGIYQGEREIASQNKLLGNLSLEGIPFAPKGVPKFEVTFEIDANGILNVSAIDKGTNRRIATTIQAKSGLNEGQIEKMIKEAETMRKSDLAKRELVTVKNDIDTMIYEANKMINGNKNILGEDRCNKIQEIIKEINANLDNENLELLKELHEKIKSETMEAGKDIYNANANSNDSEK